MRALTFFRRRSLAGIFTLICYVAMISRGFAIVDPHNMPFGDCSDFIDPHHTMSDIHHAASHTHHLGDDGIIDALDGEIHHLHPQGEGTDAYESTEFGYQAPEILPSLLPFSDSRRLGPPNPERFCRDGQFAFPDPKTSGQQFERYAQAFRNYLKKHGIDPVETLTSTGVSLSPPQVSNELAMEAWQEEVLNKVLSHLNCEAPEDWDLGSLGVEVSRFSPKPLTLYDSRFNDSSWRTYSFHQSTRSSNYGYSRPSGFPWGWVMTGVAVFGLLSLFSDEEAE
jgi:hypothetical protein